MTDLNQTQRRQQTMQSIIDVPLRAFHGDPAVKERYLVRVAAHEAADEILQGYDYWRDGKGCAVGCTLHSDEHEAYETELGVPRALAYLQDGLFERLPNADAKLFPRQFLEAIPVGADLSMVAPKMVFWALTDEDHGVLRHVTNPEIKQIVEETAGLVRRHIAGEDVSEAALAARAALAALAARAALAALAARDARDARDALAAHRRAQRDYLLQLLREAPVPSETTELVAA